MGYPPAGLTSMTRVGELVTLASSLAASSGSHTGVAVLCPSGSLDLSDESMTMFLFSVAWVMAPEYCYAMVLEAYAIGSQPLEA